MQRPLGGCAHDAPEPVDLRVGRDRERHVDRMPRVVLQWLIGRLRIAAREVEGAVDHRQLLSQTTDALTDAMPRAPSDLDVAKRLVCGGFGEQQPVLFDLPRRFDFWFWWRVGMQADETIAHGFAELVAARIEPSAQRCIVDS